MEFVQKMNRYPDNISDYRGEKKEKKAEFQGIYEKNAHGLKVSQQIHKSNEYNSYSFMHNWSSYP